MRAWLGNERFLPDTSQLGHGCFAPKTGAAGRTARRRDRHQRPQADPAKHLCQTPLHGRNVIIQPSRCAMRPSPRLDRRRQRALRPPRSALRQPQSALRLPRLARQGAGLVDCRRPSILEQPEFPRRRPQLTHPRPRRDIRRALVVIYRLKVCILFLRLFVLRLHMCVSPLLLFVFLPPVCVCLSLVCVPLVQ